MNENMGRRTVIGLLFTKGGSIPVYREEVPRHKANSCCSRYSCSSRQSADKPQGKELHRAAVPNESTPAAPRRSQGFKNANRKPPRPHESSASGSVRTTGGGVSVSREIGNRSRDKPGRDLPGRVNEGVNASRKRSLTRENSSPSSSNVLSASPSPASRNISRPSHRAASRIRKADGGPSAGSNRARRSGTRDARRNSERSDGDQWLVEQITREEEPDAGYGSVLQEALASLDDAMEEDSYIGYWRFNTGTEVLENNSVLNDRHSRLRMDIDNMSYEELLALGEQIGTVNTGLSEDALSKCLKSSTYMPTTTGCDEDSDTKCSICQEEYITGEEVGMISCKHCYHISCIQHWLRLKNWCPICKSVARDTH